MRTLGKLAWVELKLVMRDPFTLLFVFVFPLVVLLVIAGVFGSEASPEFRDVAPTDYYAAGYVATVIVALAIVGIPVHLATYRERGILRRFQASSVAPWAVLGAQMLVSLVLAAVASVILVIAAWLIYDIDRPSSVPAVLLAFLIGTLSFVSLGIMLGMLMPTARSAQAIGLGLFFPFWMLSGTGPPQEVMTGVMRTISDMLSMTWLVIAIQDPWLGIGFNVTQSLMLLGMLVVTGAVALYRVRAV
jgi:ABC-2 type transport system permease protein